jgi:hypothetical protein
VDDDPIKKEKWGKMIAQKKKIIKESKSVSIKK